MARTGTLKPTSADTSPVPGTPTPVLGSETATWAAALGLVALSYGGPPLLSRVRPAGDTTPEVLAAASGVAHALLVVAAWAGARIATGRFSPPSSLAAVLVVATVVVLAFQATIPVFCYHRHGAVLPGTITVGVSAVVFAAVLRIGGESDPLVIYGVALGWVVLVALLAVAVAEVGLRRYVTSVA